MRLLKLKNTQNKQRVIGYLAFVFDYKIKNYQNINKFIDTIAGKINRSRLIGYGGFYYKKHLRKTLRNYLFDRYSNDKFTPPPKKIIGTKIINIVKETLSKSNKYLISKIPTRIFIFPTFSEFVRDSSNGVTGFSPWKYVFYIYFHPKAKNFKRVLKLTIAHEYNHTIFLNISEYGKIFLKV